VELAAIYVYPVKSLRGFPVDRARIEQGAIVGDRMWVVVGERGNFMHQRDYPQMARVAATYASSALVLHSDGMRPLEISLSADGARGESASPAPRYVKLWRRSAPVVPTTPEADEWISQALRHKAYLMALTRTVPPRDCPDYEQNSALHDATPFHLTSESSLADLNRRSTVVVPMNRFRPNVVVSGFPAYAEDTWNRIAIGGIQLRWIKACTRCAITMTDQATGERERREPLFTLSTYRRLGREVAFGHYLVAETLSGNIEVGNPVAILERHETPTV
jgi:MOSC domain-containing protein